MEDVGVRFSGNSAGAVGAARETAGAIDKVKASATGSSVPLRGMEKDLGRVERGALAGSGAFKGLGRSVAFASTAFIGAAGLTEVIKKSIDVVLEAQTSIAHLDQAVKNAHASVKALTPIFEEQAAASAKLGFQDNDTRDAEAKLVTAFGATKQALGELKVAQDLARQSNIPLGDATRQLILLQEGNARAAKQFGISLPDLTKKQWEAKAAADGLNLAQEKGKTLYDELLPRIKDQAAAYANTPAGKIAEFHAEITHLQESIGTGLLPVVDKYLTEVDKWLADSGNQKRVTDDVRKATDDLTIALKDAKTIIEHVDQVTGGLKQTLELLIGLKLASTFTNWGLKMGLFGDATAAAEVKASGLLGTLGRLKGLGPLAIAIALDFIPKSDKHGGISDSGVGKFFSNLPVVGGAFSQANRLSDYINGVLGITGGSKSGAGRGLVSPPGTVIPGKGIQLPTFISPTHQTAGLAGFPAVDIMAKPGTPIRAPENGVITRISGHEPTEAPPDGQGGPWGLSIYFLGTQSGNTYYMTHLVKVAGLGGYEKGDVIGLIGDYPGSSADHVHFAIHAGDSSEAHVPSGMFSTSDFLGTKSGADPYGPPVTSGGADTPPVTKVKKAKWVGATAATIISAQGSVSALLRGLPTDLDPVEKNAVAHIKAIQDSLHIHMSAADLAKDRVELTKWGKVLHDEINKQAAVVKAAAAAAKKVYDQALTLDISHVLRDFDEAFQGQMHTFDTETSRHLQALQDKLAGQLKVFDAETKKGLAALVVTQTPEEKALADFEAKRAADQAAKQKSDLEQQIADTKSQLDGLGAGASGTLIDIATGTRTPIAGQQLVDQRKQLQDQLLNLQDQYDQLQLDEQDATLKAAADASRKAADDKTQADQDAYQQARDDKRAAIEQAASDDAQAYQDGRDAQKQALQDLNDDQRTMLQNSLDDWVANLEAKKKTWADFVQWMKDHGYSTTGLIDPSLAASLNDPAGAVSPGGDPRGSTRLGGFLGFAAGGKVPGRYVGRQDTILARLTPGETVIDRQLTAALEEMVANGGGGSTVAVFDINGHRFAQATARPMTDEQARQIGYTIQRG